MHYLLFGNTHYFPTDEYRIHVFDERQRVWLLEMIQYNNQNTIAYLHACAALDHGQFNEF